MELNLLAGQRQKKESNNAVIACNDYLRMGPGRSLDKLHSRYQSVTNPLPPTRRITTIKDWSRNFGWVSRATDFDAQWEHYKNEERRRVFNTELALDFERVTILNRLGQFLEEQLFEQGQGGEYHNLWVPDVKIVGKGDAAQVIDIERFNSAIIRELRDTLGDIAAETGGRVKRNEITGADGGKLTVAVVKMDVDEL